MKIGAGYPQDLWVQQGNHGHRDRGRDRGGMDMDNIRLVKIIIAPKITVSPVIKVHFPIKLFNVIRRFKWRTAFTGRRR